MFVDLAAIVRTRTSTLRSSYRRNFQQFEIVSVDTSDSIASKMYNFDV